MGRIYIGRGAFFVIVTFHGVIHMTPRGEFMRQGESRHVAIETLESRRLLSAATVIQGTVFADNDLNTTFGSVDKPLSNVRVYLDLNKNGTFDRGEPGALTDL